MPNGNPKGNGMKCSDCKHWKKIKSVPFGVCNLPDSLGLSGTIPAFEDGSRFPIGIAVAPITTDMQICSQHAPKESAQ
jgi:hypothetical protein